MSELLIITIGYVASLVTGLGFGLFVLTRKERGAAHIVFFLMTAALAGYQLSFILGANAHDPRLAYDFWFGNIVDVFLAIFYLHFIILALDALPRWRAVLIADYVVGIAIFLGAFVFPHLFLPAVVPKLYFPTYLTAGPLYLAMFVFFTLSFALSFTVMFVEHAHRGEEGKKRIEYYIFSLFYGFAMGVTAFALVFDIPLDPIFSMLIGTFVIPMVYGMVRKDLLGIRLVIERTLVFTLAIAAIAGTFTAVSLASNLLAPVIPGFNIWVVPTLAALVAVVIGTLYRRKAQESEKLKYEFVTIVAHKFRTPLTRVRWAAEALLSRTDFPPDGLELMRHIQESDLELIQLSNLLMDAAHAEKESYSYLRVDTALPELVDKALVPYHSSITEKELSFSVRADPGLPSVYVDPQHLLSAISVLIENAIAYSPKGSPVTIRITAPDSSELRFEIEDQGIGVTAAERPYIFKKFFRADRARSTDTEGVGVGLSMAKDIITRERGTIGVRSEGVGRGSTFWFTLPASKAVR